MTSFPTKMTSLWQVPYCLQWPLQEHIIVQCCPFLSHPHLFSLQTPFLQPHLLRSYISETVGKSIQCDIQISPFFFHPYFSGSLTGSNCSVDPFAGIKVIYVMTNSILVKHKTIVRNTYSFKRKLKFLLALQYTSG